MKVFIALLALVALGCSAPQPRHTFHEHYEEFLDVIREEIEEELEQLMDEYAQFEEFKAGIEYLMSPRFRNLVYEMEDIPEFKAMVEFLETHNIDILYFINQINEAVDDIQDARRSTRQAVSGRDMSAFIQDSIKLFPKDKLVALYEEKTANSESFRLAMESFWSEEWDQIYGALWQNDVFLSEVQELNANGIDVQLVLLEMRAVMGPFLLHNQSKNTMKIFIALLALVALGCSAPQPRHTFHEHYEDFLNLIGEEIEEELEQLMDEYAQFEEFKAGIEYLTSPRFRNLVYEMEDIPEFKAMVEFLETHNIDILYFINLINDSFDLIQDARRSTRQAVSGRDMSAFIQDSIKLFPKDKLVALYEEKTANSESFRLAMESFWSEEWDQIYGALWQNDVFLSEVQELNANGIDVQLVLLEMRAVMGIFD
ncbi:uncharacterized protein LOC123875293 [Maniola jurtina]|uniref:uncharacterized protein LOC123875293 n=1 Tax=Maniola jurtina TaxID=191418 RepID=UPI001E68F9A0|nr:uncharacterized protein LOC123875293 [Maniola jurtina]